MKKKGFTLVELLAVIAILAILVIMALPAVLRMFNQARKDSFTNEVNTIIRTARQQYLLNGGQAESWSNVEGSTNKLDLTGNSNLKYYVEMNGMGQITKLQATNGDFQYNETGIIDVASSSDVEEVTEENELVISPSSNSTTFLYSAAFNDGKDIGDTIVVDNVDVFDNYNDAITAAGVQFFIRYVVNGDDEITEAYVGFIKDGNPYYLKGGDSGNAYGDNKDTLVAAFTSALCTDNTSYFTCSTSSSPALSASAESTGHVGAVNGWQYCYVYESGFSRCGID